MSHPDRLPQSSHPFKLRNSLQRLNLSANVGKLSDMEYRITTRINTDTYKKLADRARSERKPESVIVREALEAHLAPRESAYDELMRTGGLGIIKSGVGDLSKNKAYMEGFGRHDYSNSHRHRSPRRASRRK